MTGTLFRSSSQRRISTVHYEHVITDDGEKLQAVPDWTEPASGLIGVELRAPDLYAYGTEAHLVDVRAEAEILGDIADLDHQQRSTVLRNLSTQSEWLHGFAAEAVRMLRTQLDALGGEEPLKLLFVANDQRAARAAADALNTVTQDNFARLVISEDANALRTLRSAAREPYPCAIVAVRMVTEGFDCPQVATIAYAANVTADLFVAQMMARAMRVTLTERASRQMLPAQILIPDHPVLRKAFANALVGQMHILDVPDETAEPGSAPTGGATGEARLPRYQLMNLSDPRLRSADVLTQQDGHVPAAQLELYVDQCRDVGIPETYAPRVAVVSRRYRAPLQTYMTTAQAPVAVAPADPRSLNRAHRARLQVAAGFMAQHIDHDARYQTVRVFQAKANDAAGIPTGGRDHAVPDQLARAANWMAARVAEHCQTHGEPMPSWAEREEQ